MKKGHARKNPGAGANANDNVITDGSRIAVNVGQMMLVVENGRIIERGDHGALMKKNGVYARVARMQGAQDEEGGEGK